MSDTAFYIVLLIVLILLADRIGLFTLPVGHAGGHMEGMINGSSSLYNSVYDNGRYLGGIRSDAGGATVPPSSISGGCQLRHRGGFGWNADLEPPHMGRGTGHVADDSVHGIKDLVRRTGLSGSDDDMLPAVNYSA